MARLRAEPRQPDADDDDRTAQIAVSSLSVSTPSARNSEVTSSRTNKTRRRVLRTGQSSLRQSTRLGTSDEDSDNESAFRSPPRQLVPKRKTPGTAQRQVRLLPLSALRNPHNSLEILPRNERLTRREPRRFLQLGSATKYRTLQSFIGSDESENEVTQTLDPDAEDSWEDSDVEGGGLTGDESASPIPAAKARSKKSAPLQELDLTLDLQALNLSDDGPASNIEPRLSDMPARRESREGDQPGSSSDKENTEAVIHFSPPRLHIQRVPSRSSTPPPLDSPSKSRLQSPSKQKVRIPSPSMRPSLDAFWTSETVNDWNDQYSPQKVLTSPRKSKLVSNTDSTITPLPKCKLVSPTKAERQAKKDFHDSKHMIAAGFLAELDEKITNGKVAELTASTGGVQVIWSKTLATTAGRANWRRERITKARDVNVPMDLTVTATSPNTTHHHASIELAEKVISDEHRLLNVLAHEFCHLANFMISGIKDQPHGAEFKRWGRLCTATFEARGVEVTTKHTYEIEYKYVWQCSNEQCGVEFKRHSKSIDTKRHTCGTCRSTLVQIRPVPRKNAAAAGTNSAADGGYAGYVKKHFADVKSQLPPGTSQKEVMIAVGQRYRQEKAKKLQDGTSEEAQTKLSITTEEVEVIDLIESTELEGLDDVVRETQNLSLLG